MNGRIFGIRAMECICTQTRPRLILSTKRFFGGERGGGGGGGVEGRGMESGPVLTPREKSPLQEAQRRVEPAPIHHAGQGAQHTTD